MKNGKNYKTKVLAVFAMIILVNNSLTISAKEIKETYLSDQIVELCQSLGDEYGISCGILESLIEAESSGNNKARNGPCYGICQINEDVWGKDYLTEEAQIKKACELINSFLEEEDSIEYALARYNGQANALEKYKSGELLKNKYVTKVITRAKELEELHKGK